MKKAPVKPSAGVKIPPGTTLCDFPTCPSPVFKVRADSTLPSHAKSYHDTVCIVTYQRPYRTTTLTRDAEGWLSCPWCSFRSMNALSTKQHAYRRCPGPPP